MEAARYRRCWPPLHPHEDPVCRTLGVSSNGSFQQQACTRLDPLSPAPQQKNHRHFIDEKLQVKRFHDRSKVVCRMAQTCSKLVECQSPRLLSPSAVIPKKLHGFKDAQKAPRACRGLGEMCCNELCFLKLFKRMMVLTKFNFGGKCFLKILDVPSPILSLRTGFMK